MSWELHISEHPNDPMDNTWATLVSLHCHMIIKDNILKGRNWWGILHIRSPNVPRDWSHLLPPHRTALHRIAPHHTAPHGNAPHHTTPQSTAPHCTTPHRTASCKSTIHDNTMQHNTTQYNIPVQQNGLQQNTTQIMMSCTIPHNAPHHKMSSHIIPYHAAVVCQTTPLHNMHSMRASDSVLAAGRIASFRARPFICGSKMFPRLLLWEALSPPSATIMMLAYIFSGWRDEVSCVNSTNCITEPSKSPCAIDPSASTLIGGLIIPASLSTSSKILPLYLLKLTHLFMFFILQLTRSASSAGELRDKKQRQMS